MFRAVQLYTFLQYCNDSPLKKEILECGAGVSRSLEPLLVRFYEQGYTTHGIEISAERLAAAQEYARSHQLDLDLRKGDMRQIPFADASMSFVFSYNTIFHMTKADIAVAMGEIERVLKPGGLCFVNFLSVDSDAFGRGEQLEKGEFLQREGGRKTVHTFFEDDEADTYLAKFEILLKEKRIRQWSVEGRKYRYGRGYIDYIARKA